MPSKIKIFLEITIFGHLIEIFSGLIFVPPLQLFAWHGTLLSLYGSLGTKEGINEEEITFPSKSILFNQPDYGPTHKKVEFQIVRICCGYSTLLLECERGQNKFNKKANVF